VIIFQEQIDREAIALSLKASKLTATTVARAMKSIINKIKKNHEDEKTPHGKQSVKKLMNHNCPTNTIPIEGDKGLFEKIARKWNVDYAFHKTGRNKYLLLFKTGQADAITAAFSEYSSKIMKRAQRNPVKEAIQQAEQQVERTRPNHRERNRAREVARE